MGLRILNPSIYAFVIIYGTVTYLLTYYIADIYQNYLQKNVMPIFKYIYKLIVLKMISCGKKSVFNILFNFLNSDLISLYSFLFVINLFVCL